MQQRLDTRSARGERRADLARMKRKARKIYPHDPAATRANHLAACSCWMCGNPRRYLCERSMPERRADIAAQAAMREGVRD